MSIIEITDNVLRSMRPFWEQMHLYIFAGALRKGGDWAGPDCRASVSYDMHIKESAVWFLIAVLLYYLFDLSAVFNTISLKARNEIKSQTRFQSSAKGFIQNAFEKCLAMTHFFMFMQLIYWKFNDQAMVMLAQPCHIILVLQGIALLSSTTLGPLLTVLMLPALTGTLLAMVVPGTSGLSPLEITCYWVQHVLIQVVPLYLLSRQNFLAAKLCTLKTVLAGIWILQVGHWVFYELVDVLFDVNVEFMLCPTFGMRDAFTAFPSFLFLPTYRTTLTWLVAILAVGVAYFYILVTRLLSSLFGSKKQD